MIVGKQSIQFDQSPFILEAASIAGKKEADGPLGKQFDRIEPDPMLGKDTWEEAESELQRLAASEVLKKSGLTPTDIRYILAGDLLEQMTATSFGLMDFSIPLFGLYGACSTMGESIGLGSMLVAGGFAESNGTRLQPFCRRRKAISFSSRLRQPAPSCGKLDGHWLRSSYYQHQKRQSAGQRNDNRKNSGLRTQRFHEYGRVHGTCRLRYHLSKFYGL